ncbi:hypothetical protein L227DRAFT_435444 [Lentinus tigrinus ALCF2SS1-6]|uniref:Uncharacterized protein n=1 Tax=Lentinus tigrinus ALCF2SS1-6 TaxID=1328759 RepID=A0A5C2SHY7_9APHY|nr:hypothetical protein L227DRAFT_435444 [Lentinus tigrinus ALCF2SS1-6]
MEYVPVARRACPPGPSTREPGRAAASLRLAARGSRLAKPPHPDPTNKLAAHIRPSLSRFQQRPRTATAAEEEGRRSFSSGAFLHSLHSLPSMARAHTYVISKYSPLERDGRSIVNERRASGRLASPGSDARNLRSESEALRSDVLPVCVCSYRLLEYSSDTWWIW